jgi:16S rRNA (cytosine967-C5)-methyltransferase
VPISSARSVAFEILLQVDSEDAYASELLHSLPASALSSRDHGLATELVMGVLRWRASLDSAIAVASAVKLDRLDPEVLCALRLGAYQVQFLSRVPVRAAIFESVELVKAARKRSAAPFVNAVLRKIKPKAGPLAEIDQSTNANALAQTASHPEWLVARWCERYSIGPVRKLCVYDQTPPGTSIRICGHETEKELDQAEISLAPGQILSSARRVVGGDVTSTRAYFEGRVSIQDEASQLVALLAGRQAMNARHPTTILDCCAAPGSKTALLAQTNPQARIFATELHPHRARLLQSRLHLPNVYVLAADARYLPFTLSFDHVLADVPCSGTGTLARNPEIKWRLSAEDLLDLQKRQVAILKSALAQLASGGRLVYSTCSLEQEENEDVVKAAFDGSSEFIVIDLQEELEQMGQSRELSWRGESILNGPYLRTLPGTHPCDGFFVAMLGRK